MSLITEQSTDIPRVPKLHRKRGNPEDAVAGNRHLRGDPRSTAFRMAARIYRASIGRLDLDITHILGSREFKRFLAQTGRGVTPLTPLFDVGYYLGKIPTSLQQEINPVLHFCLHGDDTGLAPTRLFHAEYVASVLRGDAQAAVDLVSLFVAVIENVEPPFISPHPLFEPEIWTASFRSRRWREPGGAFPGDDKFRWQVLLALLFYSGCMPNAVPTSVTGLSIRCFSISRTVGTALSKTLIPCFMPCST